MKDEEMAEEIANKRCHEIMCYGHCSFNSPKHHRCGEWHREYNCALEGIEYGYSQANDWHYVKDGDFPSDKTEKKYLVALKSEYGGFFYETDIWCESLHCFASNNPTKVYAWQKIVQPELPKEIE